MAWLSGWNKRVELTIDHTDVDSTLSDFPVLVHLGTSVGRNSDDVSFVFDELTSDANRKKIAVTTSDGETECYVEIGKWDDANEVAWLWVKVPSVASGADTVLYLYYDSSHADNTARVGDPSDAVVHNVWDSDFEFVSHMRDDPDTSHIRDSTGNANDGTKAAAGDPTVTTSGKINDAQDFDGTGDYITLGSHISLADETLWTLSFWAKSNDTGTALKAVLGDSVSDKFWVILRQGNYVYLESAAGTVLTIPEISDFSEWHHFVFTIPGLNLVDTYIDGSFLVQDAWGDCSLECDYIGRTSASASYDWNGLIDEVRISSSARSAAWIKASHESEIDDLLDFGSEEEATPSGLSMPVAMQYYKNMRSA